MAIHESIPWVRTSLKLKVRFFANLILSFDRYEDEKTGDPSPAYWKWAEEGWASKEPIRYPMGRGKKPLYCWYNGKRLACM
jgi:hypothetical protein